MYCANFDEVFHATAAGSAQYGVVGVENSTEGVVTRSLDLFLHTPTHVVGEVSLLVRHNLLRRDASLDGIEVVMAHPQALAQWQRQLSHLAGTLDLPDWEAPRFDPWQLSARQHLNPGSQGEPVFHLELAPSAGAELPAWEAGDLVQVCAPADPDRPREYSIASIPADGRIHLLVRQAMRSDGSPGLASGWLTAGAGLGEPIALRLRAHSGFRLGGNAARPLILIGNGTGLAGLRAHLKARAASAAPVAGRLAGLW